MNDLPPYRTPGPDVVRPQVQDVVQDVVQAPSRASSPWGTPSPVAPLPDPSDRVTKRMMVLVPLTFLVPIGGFLALDDGKKLVAYLSVGVFAVLFGLGIVDVYRHETDGDDAWPLGSSITIGTGAMLIVLGIGAMTLCGTGGPVWLWLVGGGALLSVGAVVVARSRPPESRW